MNRSDLTPSRATASRINIPRLIFVPALISLGVTILRLAGELGHWSDRWFSSETGGIVPSGMSWIVGITWLAVPFGVFFAWKLVRNGDRPSNAGRAVGVGILGLALVVGLLAFIRTRGLELRPRLLLIWSAMALGAIIQALAWPALFKTLLAYGLAARIPVVILMFLAMRGDWGTHYDYVGIELQMSLLPKFFWLAFFPQLVFWVGFTILVGSLSGSVAAAMMPRRNREQAVSS